MCFNNFKQSVPSQSRTIIITLKNTKKQSVVFTEIAAEPREKIIGLMKHIGVLD